MYYCGSMKDHILSTPRLQDGSKELRTLFRGILGVYDTYMILRYVLEGT